MPSRRPAFVLHDSTIMDLAISSSLAAYSTFRYILITESSESNEEYGDEDTTIGSSERVVVGVVDC